VREEYVSSGVSPRSSKCVDFFIFFIFYCFRI
jgi:hypothetical protein